MPIRFSLGSVLCLLCVGVLETDAQETTSAKTLMTVDALSAVIDKQISARWTKEAVKPAPATDDAEFLRRTYLNIVGRTPPVSEVREFLADESLDKRRRLVDRLLESPAYIAHYTNVWRSLMVPEADTNLQLRVQVPVFEAWLRRMLIDNVNYDRLVRELLTATPATPQQQVTQPGGNQEPSAQLFYMAKENKAENLAAGAARVFLGIQIGCAQCHPHPFAKWKREDFWGFAAFFSGPNGNQTITIPDSEQTVPVKYLDGTAPGKGGSLREPLAEWMTSAKNPYFARASANRIWAKFFGLGLVDPVDDFDELNPPSHPELLDELAEQFASHEFDVKYLIRAITGSKAYQLTSEQTNPSQEDPTLFARMAVQGLTPEQLFDSLAQATGFYEAPGLGNPLANNNSVRSRFRELFANEAAAPTEAKTSILQALALMNGEFISNAVSLENSVTLTAIIESPFSDTKGRIEILYLAALGREPQPNELSRLVKYVEAGGATDDQKAALGDVFWVLLNSSEFILNH